MANVIGYRIYKEFTDENGDVIHKRPLARTGKKEAAINYARAWCALDTITAVYECYSDGTQQQIYTC